MTDLPTVLRIGPAGWSYPDWWGYVYPPRRGKGFHEATYLADFFDTIEINTSFYRPLQPELVRQWISKIEHNPRFQFTAKLWQKFTHQTGASAEDERSVREGFDVLRDAGKLGAVLVQFPFAFHRDSAGIPVFKIVLNRFRDYPLVVEFRHASWQVPETYEYLRERQVGFCNIDQPILGRSLQPSAERTSEIGYVRLHGRRYDTWFSDDPETPAYERYNYLYSAEELLPWAERIRAIGQEAKQVYVVANNHYLGKGVVNALELLSMLKGEKVKVPETLRDKYHELENIADRPQIAPRLF